jgi:hypothetical protein
MRKQILLAVFSIGLLGLGWTAGAQESPRAEPRELRGQDLSESARAVLQIKSEAGICYWSITGDDDLVRLPVADERFPSILLSARFGEDQLHLTLAGERAPLDTSSLGQFDLGLLDGSPVTVNGFRAAKAGNKGWELRVLPPTPR